ncbi:MAG: DUF192 domain-containing protein [Gammaproteobacteria bacterium]|nr:DUF192 domain-containing protein [Gammaproteobacteria bacterium]
MRQGIVTILNETTQSVAQLNKMQRIRHILEHLLGLIGHPQPLLGGGLWIDYCGAIHTGFLRYNIDVVYLDQRGHIVKLVPQLRPWRVSACWPAVHTLELAAGSIEHFALQRGQRVQWQTRNDSPNT